MNKWIKRFEEILSIPRPSGREEKIARYLCDFARKNRLEFFKDELNNVIIKKDNGSDKTIILQGHTDMVCVADKGVLHNFYEEGINYFVEDGFIKAKGTTLGADNGIGVAIILGILGEDEPGFPNIEAVFTVQEETTMAGAKGLDYSLISGKNLISLDGDREGVLEVSSAGISDLLFEKKLKEISQKPNTSVYSVEISNLIGGHSGEDINKNRLNAIEILGKILKEINPIGIISIFGGERSNVIPSTASCEFVTEKTMGEVSFICSKYRELAEENDNHPTIFASKLEDKNWVIFDEDEVVSFITEFEHGVIHSIDGNIPLTSENMGILRLEGGKIKIRASVRSSIKQEEADRVKFLNALAKIHGFSFEILCQNPF
ncbi:MAG: M20/M25/M40 family metallo-hydrolase, partial [Clostridia bacterium]|nr:M20/M25/M40 family metallo-hydrolase [Clostridia bacterium]